MALGASAASLPYLPADHLHRVPLIGGLNFHDCSNATGAVSSSNNVEANCILDSYQLRL